ncbi:hypothetical protein AAFF_G00390480 [Aldrovandia affinis]|uniref:Uncharacterized protein n=1 Tax=Aldrovandia affinis TaxID=143900 RepID=A0AAD7SGM7_9TELE|nr:hypothetical protein AAFF_G00390480 [Aldrovandia affinis]
MDALERGGVGSAVAIEPLIVRLSPDSRARVYARVTLACVTPLLSPLRWASNKQTPGWGSHPSHADAPGQYQTAGQYPALAGLSAEQNKLLSTVPDSLWAKDEYEVGLLQTTSPVVVERPSRSCWSHTAQRQLGPRFPPHRGYPPLTAAEGYIMGAPASPPEKKTMTATPSRGRDYLQATAHLPKARHEPRGKYLRDPEGFAKEQETVWLELNQIDSEQSHGTWDGATPMTGDAAGHVGAPPCASVPPLLSLRHSVYTRLAGDYLALRLASAGIQVAQTD